MRYLALATDYDGTIATDGRLDEATIDGLERLRDSGRRLILVTGRELEELLEVCPRLDLFDRVVAENGAVLYWPESHEEKVLTERPPERFVALLRERGVQPLSVGRAILATWEPHQTVVLETIRELGVEYQVIFNKGAVMILPSGVNKATGLKVALNELGLSSHNTVGVGDAENDHAFLAVCELSAAVSNALPMLKQRVDFVALGHHGAGVVELIDRMLGDDLQELSRTVERHQVLLGTGSDGAEHKIGCYGVNILVAGTSGSGKSTITTGLLERLAEAEYQYTVIDPEGDYSTLDGSVMLGSPRQPPTEEEILDLIETARQNAVVNLLGIPIEQRPAFFDGLLPRLQRLRGRTGRPHWIVIDEAHHLLPTTWHPATVTLPHRMESTLMITVHPQSVARAILDSVDLVLGVGERPEETIRAFCEAVEEPVPELSATRLEPGEVLAWWRRRGEPPMRVRCERPRSERRRHSRKYAEGNLGPDRSFFFRGPEGALNLRAQNLNMFLQIGDGVDDATWMFHLRDGSYSSWFREMIKDAELGEEAARIEANTGLDAAESRAAIRTILERRYTLPSEPAEYVKPRNGGTPAEHPLKS